MVKENSTYYSRHRDECLARQKAYYYLNREKRLAYQKERYYQVKRDLSNYRRLINEK